jgi:hypothetical protein
MPVLPLVVNTVHKTFQALAQNQCEPLDLDVVREWKRRKGSFLGGTR